MAVAPLQQLFTHSQDSEWFSTIFVIIFEDNIVTEQRKKHIGE